MPPWCNWKHPGLLIRETEGSNPSGGTNKFLSIMGDYTVGGRGNDCKSFVFGLGRIVTFIPHQIFVNIGCWCNGNIFLSKRKDGSSILSQPANYDNICLRSIKVMH